MNVSVAIKVGMSCLNVPYIWGGNNPLQGLDCSGFIIWILRSVGMWGTADDSAQGIHGHFSTIEGCPEQVHLPFPKEGCLLFFGADKGKITHVAMSIGEGLMIEAGGAGSKCRTPADATLAGACVRIRPIANRRDLVSVLCPS